MVLYSSFGVDRVVVCEIASDHETPETVRDGYCRAYLTFLRLVVSPSRFKDRCWKYSPNFGLSLTQMCPNLLRQFLAILVRAREEKLMFGLMELRQLFSIKRNKQSPS